VDEGTCDDEATVVRKTRTGNQSLGVLVLTGFSVLVPNNPALYIPRGGRAHDFVFGWAGFGTGSRAPQPDSQHLLNTAFGGLINIVSRFARAGNSNAKHPIQIDHFRVVRPPCQSDKALCDLRDVSEIRRRWLSRISFLGLAIVSGTTGQKV